MQISDAKTMQNFWFTHVVNELSLQAIYIEPKSP